MKNYSSICKIIIGLLIIIISSCSLLPKLIPNYSILPIDKNDNKKTTNSKSNNLSITLNENKETIVKLFAKDYYDLEGSKYTYSWDFFRKPDNCELTISSNNGEVFEFSVSPSTENIGIYAINLTIDDRSGNIVTKAVDVSVGTIPVNLDGYPNALNTGIKAKNLSNEDLVATGSIHIKVKGTKPIIDFGGESKLRTFTFNSDGTLTGESSDPSKGNIYIDGKKLIIKQLFVNDGIFMYEKFWDNDLIDECVIEECLIKSKNSNTRPSYGISLKASPRETSGDVVKRTTIRYCTLFNERKYPRGENPHASGKAILAKGCIIENCDISGFADGIFISSNNLIRENYIHGLHAYSPAWDGKGGDGTHSDGIQTTGGTNNTITRNTIDTRGFYNNSAIIIQDMAGEVSNLTISNNYLLGGSYTFYVKDRNDGYVIEDNKQVLVHNNPYSIRGESLTITDNIIYNVNEDRVFAHSSQGDGHPIYNYTYQKNKTHLDGDALIW